jgi:hypothetical protein
MIEELGAVASAHCPGVTAYLSHDGLLVYRPIPGLVISHALALKILEIGSQVVKVPTPTLVLMQDMARVDRDARALFASEAYSGISSMTALVVGSPVSRVIGNFFVGLNRPRHGFRIFDDPALARGWLRGFVP